MRKTIQKPITANPERLFSSIFPARLSKGDRKKIEIVEMAVALFKERGVDQTSYDEIAGKLGTTRSHITYHFKDREDLVLATVRYMMSLGHEFTFENMRKALSPSEQMVKYVDSYYDFFYVHPQFIPIMLYFYYFSGFPGPLRDLQTQVRKEAFARIHELISQILTTAKKRKSANLDDLTFAVQSLILGGMIFNISTGEPVSESATKANKQKILMGISEIVGVRVY